MLTKSDIPLNSSNSFWYLRIDTLPLLWMAVLIAMATSALRLRAAMPSPVVRMVMSILPVDGSTAACFRASLYSLSANKEPTQRQETFQHNRKENWPLDGGQEQLIGKLQKATPLQEAGQHHICDLSVPSGGLTSYRVEST